MEKPSVSKKQLLKELQSSVQTLQEELIKAKKIEGINPYITVKVQKNQAHFEKGVTSSGDDKAIGKFILLLDVNAKKETLYIPLSIASGKKPTGFLYQIEGTGEGTITTASVTCRGEAVTQVTVGTLLYTKIPQGKVASFHIQVKIGGVFGKTYKIILNRINYKLQLADARYMQYEKQIISDSVKFS